MRRLAAIATVLALVAAGAVLLAGSARSDGGPYTVRAIFDDASYAATGEDVRVAGANVGAIQSLGVTHDNQAAVTITVTNGDFAPFYANAHCTIRPQSLIGDEYVDCSPGTSSAKPLQRIRRGLGAGDYYLPVTQTSSPIDTDIVQDLSTDPVRESLSVILGELGTGLAGRGSDLNAVIRRANPALGNTDKVIRILAAQNRTLAALATNSDAVLAPLARERRQLAGFVTSAATTATATAARAADISRTFHEFPGFLRQLRPLMANLSTLSEQGTPVMQELGGSAGALGRQFAELTPFAKAARTSLVQLGNATQQAQPALVASEPLARRLLSVGRGARPSADSLATLLQSLNSTGGIEQLMGLLYEGTSAGNGFDSLGHYVRAEPLTSSCTNYVTTPVGGCSANYTNGKGTTKKQAASAQAADTPAEAIVQKALREVSSGSAQNSVGGLLDYLMGSPK